MQEFKNNPSGATQDQSNPDSFNDFEMLLDSLIPLKFFVDFLESEKPNFIPYFCAIQVYKLREWDIRSYIEQEGKIQQAYLEKFD